ncbi:MAG: hypothetical protein AAFP20_25795, partial [Cyanobacteria bacterium J06614_10]
SEPSFWHKQFTCQNLSKSVQNFLSYSTDKDFAEKSRKKEKKKFRQNRTASIFQMGANNIERNQYNGHMQK